MKNILVFGGLLLDRYIFIDSWPERGQDGYIRDEVNYVGGCAINMTVTTQNLILREKEDSIKVHVVSAIGEDRIAKEITEYMNSHQLSSRYLFKQKGASGSCIVFSEENGERTFLTKKGVEITFTPEICDKIIEDGATVVGITGYYLLSPDAKEIIRCLKGLKARGSRILFDPSPLVGDIKSDVLKEMWALTDLATPNDTEIQILKNCGILSDYNLGDKVIIQKAGSHGGTVYSPEETFRYEAVSCQAVDTTGAGDSFSGALLYGLTKELSLKECIHLAINSAAQTVMIQGPHGFW